MKDVFVLTHPESIHHVEGRVGGWYDTGLTDRGRRQAFRAAARLEALLPNRDLEIFSSDLLRASQTAAAVASVFGVDPILMRDLREISYGSAEGMPEEWLREREVPAPEDNRLDHRGGVLDTETKREFATRIYRAVATILARPCSTQIVVTHGFAMTFVVAAWVTMPIESTGHINLRSTPGGLTHLREDDYRRNRAVLMLNDVTHLDEE